MSQREHEWSAEQLAAHAAGGLPAADRARLETHIGGCAECIAESDAIRRFERSMDDLFAPVRAKPGLEERVIRVLRSPPARRRRPALVRLLLAVAAVVVLGAIGYLAEHPLELPDSAPGFIKEVAYHHQTQQVKNSELTASSVKSDNRDSMIAILRSEKAQLKSAGELASERADNVLVTLTSPTGGGGGTPLTGATFMLREMDFPGVDIALAKNPSHALETSSDSSVYNDRMQLWSTGRTEGTAGGHRATMDNGYGDVTGLSGQTNNNYSVTAFWSKMDGDTGWGDGKILFGYRSDAVSAGRVTTGKGEVPYYIFKNGGPTGKPAEGGYFKPTEMATLQREAEEAAAKLNMSIKLKGNSETRDDVVRQDLKREQPKTEPKKEEPGLKGEGQTDRAPDVAQKAANKPQENKQEPPKAERKIIRQGEMEFEIEAFDTATTTITKIVVEEGGYVATVNSEKLANGKVKGSIVLRVPPERLDTLVLKLRALGELKTQKIGSEDITKQYTDLESRLRAARAMETRILEIIKTGKGEIKDLLLAEKELGEWRTKIEQMEGEIRYYNGLIALSTLTITLYEKEIRAPSGAVETERIQMGVEVDDVEKAHRDALAAIADAKGRVTKSEVKQYAAGQFQAVIEFEVAPDAAGTLRDRLRQLGVVTRLDIDRLQQTEGGSGKPQEVKVRRADTIFAVSLFNVANVAPRETANLSLACADAEAAYRAILARVEKAGGRIVTSQLNRQKNEQTTGTVQFEVKSAEAGSVQADLRALGEVMSFETIENPDSQTVTRSKQGFKVQVFALGSVAPREETTLQLVARDVPGSYQALLEALRKFDGRVLSSQLNEQDRQNITALIDCEIRREKLADLEKAIGSAGDVLTRVSNRAQDIANTVDSKTRIKLALINVAAVRPRETFTLGVEVSDVDKAAAALAALAAEHRGRTVESHFTSERNGRIVAKIVVDVPLSASGAAVDRVKGLGTVRIIEASRNPAVPECSLTVARLDVTLSNSDLILPSDAGPLAHAKKGLTWLAWSANLIILGLCVIGPWALVGWVGWKVYRRVRPARPAA